MLPFWRDHYGNPSSLHGMGQDARHAVEEARHQVASLIGAKPREIVFTSGGTEANNLAILGALALRPDKRHIITTAVEHVSAFSLCERLARRNYRVTFVPVDSQGRLDLDQFRDALNDDTALATVMHANNETGYLFPITDIAKLTAEKGVPLHVDAVQTTGKIPLRAADLGANQMTISAHKIHGPKGIGALYLAPGTRLESQLVGGHQERDIRPGTENVAAIVGFGKAAELARHRLDNNEWKHIAALRDRLEQGLLAQVPTARVLGDANQRVWNTTLIAFEAMEAEQILIGLSERGVCASSGSACSSGSLEPSHVLAAMGIEERFLRGAVRFSLSWDTAPSDIDQALQIIPSVVNKLAALRTP